MLNKQSSQLLNLIEQSLARLLNQHLSKQYAQRSDIPPQRVVLSAIPGLRREFIQAGSLIIRFP